MDGAGNVFVANYGSTSLTEMTAAGVQTTFGSGLNEPQGLAIDGAGTIYVENSGVPNVVKFVNGSTTPTVVATLPTQFGRNIVVDGSGNLFVADNSSGIQEIAAGSSTATAFATPGVNLPSLGGELGVAVDAAGNVYATPESSTNTQVYEIPASGGNAFLIGTSNNTNGIALDASGRLYLANYGGTISVIDRTQAATLTFANTVDGATSAAQTVLLENDGNAALTFAIPGIGVTNPTTPTDFTFTTTGSTACPSLTHSSSTPGTLAAGSSCTVPITFTPVSPSSGALSESLIFTDNSLNAVSTTQTIALSGTASLPAPILSSLSPTAGTTAGGTTVTITGTNFIAGATTVTIDGTVIAASSVTVTSTTSLTFTTPAHATGTVGVAVTTAGGSSNNLTFTYYTPVLTSLSVVGYGSPAIITEGGTLVVTAADQLGNPGTGFTVTLTSSDPKATLPAAYTFQISDNGSHTFNVSLNTLGTQSITATSGSVSGSQTGILVGDAVWVLSADGAIHKLNSQGSVKVAESTIFPTGSGSFGGIAIDSAGTVWTAATGNNLLGQVNLADSTDNTYSGAGLNQPKSIAVDGAGFLWIANSGNNTVSEFNNSGSAITSSNGFASAYSLNGPASIAIDRTGSVWVANQTGNSVTHIFGAATPTVTPLSTAATNSTLGTKP